MFEINLVPDVKLEMIKAQKVRNLVLFICIVVSAVAVGVVMLLLTVIGGQNVIMGVQDGHIKKMSEKINGYDGLSEFLTIQDQLGKLSKIDENRKVLSRVFNLLDVTLPKNGDTVSISELNVDLTNDTLKFEGQADAGKDPMIDYRVLLAFKKTVELAKYDYGRYVDDAGREIPTRCIKESGDDGSSYVDKGRIYAIWMKDKEGCNPAKEEGVNLVNEEENQATEEGKKEGEDGGEVSKKESEGVKIYRTPKFEEWKKAGHITDSGEITGIPHFQSSCIKYNMEMGGDGARKWSAVNECSLAPDGVIVDQSSNGRDSSGNLVLRFSASIKIDKNVFAFKNKHVMAIGPTGQNVTDSFVQIKNMFAEKAADCADDDVACKNNKKNSGEE